MFECKFILPVVPGKPFDEQVHPWLEQQLVDQFGGFTAQACRGAWKDGSGAGVRDISFMYTVAVRKRADADALCRLACDAAEKAGQQALYFVDQAGPHVLDLVRHRAPIQKDGDAYGGNFTPVG